MTAVLGSPGVLQARRPGKECGRRTDEGSLSVEMVILAVVVATALCLGIGAGTLVLADGRVSAAAAAAARAASQQNHPAAAAAVARASAQQVLTDSGTTCIPDVDVDTSQFRPGGRVDVQVNCRVDLTPVAIAGFPAHRTLSASAGAPLERHRSYQDSP
ncbi:hypothetical protein LWF15_24280 [Kineosporia rhizophila]|uniref:hypothetical protein n=1 Tax=Kineosporia TaxID=49184 RepID=UPI001E5AF66A|nr:MULTISPECIES: hypothetical protein [Kineosporia]MCE0538621.1 hypothetical protein [Kineosporia rhizophila]GLY19586.1 hypothetical protein Kisp01_66000 [Kineosporia sp. NBRC 101677]